MAGSTAVPQRREPTPDEFVAMQQSPEFQDLRGTFRGFTFPVTVSYTHLTLPTILLV